MITQITIESANANHLVHELLGIIRSIEDVEYLETYGVELMDGSIKLGCSVIEFKEDGLVKYPIIKTEPTKTNAKRIHN